MSASSEKQARRRRRVAEAQALYAAGLPREEIAARLGVARVTMNHYLSDPDGAKARAYCATFSGVCEVCGRKTYRSRTRRCRAHARRGAPPRLWSRETVVESIRLWVLTYGELPSVRDWSPSNGTPEQRARYFRLRSSYQQNSRRALIPAVTTVFGLFGSWNAAIEAAGFTPRPSGGSYTGHRNVCRRGHELTPENRYVYPDGHWACRRCRRDASRRHKQRQRRRELLLLG